MHIKTVIMIWRWHLNRLLRMTKVENRMRPECLALDWQRALGLHDFQLSIVDIYQAPIPLAFEIIQADNAFFAVMKTGYGKRYGVSIGNGVRLCLIATL
jgi:hypothetical protein